jgi:hypothetical protein
MKFQTTKMKAFAAAAVAAALLVACGGGDGEGDSPTSGGFTGVTSTNRDLTAVVLPDGRYWLMYSAAGDASTVGGVVQGTASVDGSTFTSNDAMDFSAEGTPSTKAATVAANFGGSFGGTVTPAAGASVTFQSRSDNGAPVASLQRLAGAYLGNAGFALGVRPATFTVTSDGAVASTINGCAISGQATPRADSNAYDLAIAFGGAPCALPGLAFTGIAYLRIDGRLYAAARNTTYKTSVIFSGSKS